MTIEQTALVVREAIRQAALEYDVLPSQALNPTLGHRRSIAARNRAVRLCFDQGITRHELAEAFRRDARVIRMALARTKPD